MVFERQGPIPTAPFSFLSLDLVKNSYDSSAIAVLPVPYDGTASYKTGARDGPEAIISASKELEEYDVELECEPCKVGIYTAPFVEPNMGSPEAMVERVEKSVGPLVRDGKLVSMLGGDHSITIGAVRAFSSIHPDLSVLYLDAHADLRHEYMGTLWGHASTARRVSEICPLVLAGVRSMSIEEANFITTSNVKYFPWLAEQSGLLVNDLLEALKSPIYISIDLDVLDPALMASVGTPVPGGMPWHYLLTLLRRVAEVHRIVGFDVVELSPREGPAACSFTAASLAYKLMGYCTVFGAKLPG